MLRNSVTAEELRVVLTAVETGSVTITPEEQPDDVYAGNVIYHASNGWTITVFNDCNCWDYLDSVESPDGRYDEYPSGLEPEDERGDLYDLFVSYAPPDSVIRDIYGFRY